MFEPIPGARNVSYLKKDLPLTSRVLQRIENNWFLREQHRSQGLSSLRQNLENLVLLPVYSVVGIPEISLDMAKYAFVGLVRGCNWE